MKVPITWIGLTSALIKEKNATQKGIKASLKDIIPEAKKQWAAIKAGTDPKYSQGTPTKSRKAKSGKSSKDAKSTKKNTKKKSDGGSSSSSKMYSEAEVKELLLECKVCKKCTKRVEKLLAKKQKGGKGDYGNNDVESRKTTDSYSVVERDDLE